MMTINELIERLDEYRSMLGGDAEVRLMIQQNWPFENEVHGICSKDEIDGGASDDEEDEDANVVYIVEGTQLGYGRKQAWSVCG